MVSCTVWFVLLSSVALCNGLDNLYPLDVGLFDEDPFLPNERDTFDDCHMRYSRYGVEELLPPSPLQPPVEGQEYSHVAAIGWTQSSGTIDWACLGTLIWNNYVLTSAHCTLDERNTAPDVVRLGETDPAHTQQRTISKVIRHPDFVAQTGLHDIAVLQLEKRVLFNNSVTPACLWLAPETIFPQMQFLQRSKENSELSLVEAEQTNQQKCASSVASTDGERQTSQLCIEPTETNPAKCFDKPTGNPLLVRLLHNFKTSPFVVGFMAGGRSGTSCRPASPFTRIGSYASWIMEELKNHNSTATPMDFIAPICALRYVQVRPQVEELLMERFNEAALFALNVEARHAEDLKYIVRIVWPTEAGKAARNDCAGTFVDQKTVLTLAECVATTTEGYAGVTNHKPAEVQHSSRYRNVSYPIKSITVHPGYVRGSMANNIAVIKLDKVDNVVPACVWPFEPPLNTRVDLAGVGASILNNNIGGLEYPEESTFAAHHLRAVDHLPWANCVEHLDELNRTLVGADSGQHVCYWNDQWIVPGACGVLPGGPVQRYVARAGVFVKYVYALSLVGPSCGQGLPAVAVLVKPHVPWLRSVMMETVSQAPVPAKDPLSDSVIVINPDLKRSDECSNGDGTLGICVPHEMCLSTQERLRKGERLTLCSVGSVVCCPWGDIARNAPVNPIRVDLERCEARSHAFRQQRLLGRTSNDSLFSNFPHLAELGWPQNNAKLQFHCMGYLITTNTIITSAKCANSQLWNPTVARIGSLNAADSSNYILQPIRRVTVHEEYDDVTGVNNLALIQLTTHIKPTVFYFPGCLFNNATHVPVRQFSQQYDDSSLTTERVSPLYGEDCREQRAGETLPRGQLCYLRRQPEYKFLHSSRCFKPGDMMMWTRTTEEEVDDADYLVAIFNHGSCSERTDVQTATRISAYYDWIVSNIK